MGSGLWALWFFWRVAAPGVEGVSGVPGFQRGGKSAVLNHLVLVPFTVGPCQQAFDHLMVVHRVVGLLVHSVLRKTLGTFVAAAWIGLVSLQHSQ